MSVWKSDETLLSICILNSLLGVSSGDETLHLMFDIIITSIISDSCGRFYFFAVLVAVVAVVTKALY